MTTRKWQKIQEIPSYSYVCSYCGNTLASNKGWYALDEASRLCGFLCICHHCHCPTFIDESNIQHPGVAFGRPVKDISDQDVHLLYEEARMATAAGSYTAAVLACRKILMHLAVAKGAKEGESFASYVTYLEDNHYIPMDSKEWVDQIRKRGNEANHEITVMQREDAEELCTFLEMLLKLFYEYPSAARRRVPQP